MTLFFFRSTRGSLANSVFAIGVLVLLLSNSVAHAAEPDGSTVFVRGDPNGDGKIDITDSIQMLTFQFLGTPQLGCLDSADANDDGRIDIGDPTFVVRYAFMGESAPPPPLAICDVDPTPDELGCSSFSNCELVGAPPDPRVFTFSPRGGAGDLVTVEGLNLVSDMDRYEITFLGMREDAVGLPGVPVAVRLSPDPDREPYVGHGSIEAMLDVLVPTGAESGTMEIALDGELLDSVDFTANPVVTAFSLGKLGNAETLAHNGVFGFDLQLGPETVQLHGLNFDSISEIGIEDGSGNLAFFSSFDRLGVDENTGLDTLVFSLEGVRVAIFPPSEELSLVARTPGGDESNAVFVPVVVNELLVPFFPSILRVTINGVILPLGTRAGPVRMRYSIYDRPINMAYKMEFEWTVDGGATWLPALLDFDDSVAHGTDRSLPGVVLPGGLDFDTQSELLSSGGAIRVFTWDAPNDRELRRLMETRDEGGRRTPRHQAMSFRARAVPTL
jgi:hypothetical protein